MTRARVTQLQRLFQRAELGVRFVNDHRRPVFPVANVRNRRVQCHAAMQWLLDENQTFEETSQHRIRLDAVPEFDEARELAILLIAVQGEREVLAAIFGDDLRDRTQSLQVSFDISLRFELEVPEFVGTNTVFQRLWQAVVDTGFGREVGSRQRIGQSDRVPGDDFGQRLCRQKLIWRAACQLRVNRRQIQADAVFPQQRGQVTVLGPGERVEHGAFNHTDAELRQQRRKALLPRPRHL